MTDADNAALTAIIHENAQSQRELADGLKDLSRETSKGFDRVRERVTVVETKLDERKKYVDQADEMQKDIAELQAAISAIRRDTIWLTIVGAFIISTVVTYVIGHIE